jgi:hypothetical protein
MSSGTYFPPAVRAVEIPQPHGGGTRTRGIPTVADRVAQTVAALTLEPRTESIFHDDSVGYRPGRSQHQALARCWERAWVIDLDVAEHLDVIGDGVRAGVALPQLVDQCLAGVVAPGRQRVVSQVRLNVAAANSLSECATTKEASIRITTVVPRSRSPTRDGGIWPCRLTINDQTCSRVSPELGRPCLTGSRRSRPGCATTSHPRPPARTAHPGLAARPDPTSPDPVSDQHRGLGQHPTPIMHRHKLPPRQRR